MADERNPQREARATVLTALMREMGELMASRVPRKARPPQAEGAPQPAQPPEPAHDDPPRDPLGERLARLKRK